MDYHAVRMRHAQARIADWLRRWGLWLALLTGLLAMGSGSSAQQLATLPVALALPMFTAAAHGPLALLGATLAYVLAGALPVWLTRPLWWPARWAETERALPLTPAVLAASDRRCVRWGWLPLQALLALGAALLLWLNPAELRGGRGWAVAALLLAAWASDRLGQCAMAHWRRVARPGPPAATPAAPHVGVRPHHPVWPLLLWPLWRGPAQRAGRLLALLLVLAPLPLLLLQRWPRATGWALALALLLAVPGAALLARRLRDALTPLWQAAAALPLPTPPARWARALPLTPAVLTLTATLAALAAWAPPWRAAVLAGWLLLAALALARATGTPTRRADQDAAWMLLWLALALAAGSAVTP